MTERMSALLQKWRAIYPGRPLPRLKGPYMVCASRKQAEMFPDFPFERKPIAFWHHSIDGLFTRKQK